MNRVKQLFSILLAVPFLPSVAQAQISAPVLQRLPASMGAMGDSMSAGMFANLRRQDAENPFVAAYFLGEVLETLLDIKTHGLPLDAAYFHDLERRNLSWSTGLDSYNRVTSHAKRLQTLNPGFQAVNVAVSGASVGSSPLEIYKLRNQVPRLIEWSQQNLHQNTPDYVTIMIGPNDICADNTSQMLSTADYYAGVADVLDQIHTANPNVKILLGSVPNIESLKGVAENSTLLGVGSVAGTCSEVWKTSNLCYTLTREEDPAERQKVSDRVAEYNVALGALAQDRGTQWGDAIHYAPQTFQVTFTPDDLSVDCFHPNPSGQQKLSDATWKGSWWTEQWKQKEAEIDAQQAAAQAQDEARLARCALEFQNQSSKGPRDPSCYL